MGLAQLWVKYCQPRSACVTIQCPAFWAFVGGDAGIYGAWCNGSTTVFGTVYPGSNPGAPA